MNARREGGDIYKKLIFYLAALLTPILTIAQSFEVEIEGRIIQGEKKCENASVVLYRGNQIIDKQFTGNNGKFNFKVISGDDYTVKAFKKGLVGKKVTISTRYVSNNTAIRGWQIILPEYIKGIDISVFENPVGKIFFDTIQRKFAFNKFYEDSIKNALNNYERDMIIQRKKIAYNNVESKQFDEKSQNKEKELTFEEPEETDNLDELTASRSTSGKPDSGEATKFIRPGGWLVETFSAENCKITRYVYSSETKHVEFRKIEHRWGTIYKKDGKDISEYLFLKETVELEQ